MDEHKGDQERLPAGMGLGVCMNQSQRVTMHMSRCQNQETWSLPTLSYDCSQVT